MMWCDLQGLWNKGCESRCLAELKRDHQDGFVEHVRIPQQFPLPGNHLGRGTQHKNGLPEIDLDIKRTVVFFCIISRWGLGTHWLHYVHLGSQKASSWKYCLIIIIISPGISKIIKSYQEGKSNYNTFSPLKWFVTFLLIFIIMATFCVSAKGIWLEHKLGFRSA